MAKSTTYRGVVISDDGAHVASLEPKQLALPYSEKLRVKPVIVYPREDAPMGVQDLRAKPDWDFAVFIPTHYAGIKIPLWGSVKQVTRINGGLIRFVADDGV